MRKKRNWIMPEVKVDRYDLIERTEDGPVTVRAGMTKGEADQALVDAVKEFGKTVTFFLKRRRV